MTASSTTTRPDETPQALGDRVVTTGPAPGADQRPPGRLVAVPTPRHRVGRRSGGPHLRVVPEAGMATAEYAVALIAACAFAAVLLAAIRTNAVMSAIGRLITTALRVIS